MRKVTKRPSGGQAVTVKVDRTPCVTRDPHTKADPNIDIGPGDVVAMLTDKPGDREAVGTVVAVFNGLLVCRIEPERGETYGAWRIESVYLVKRGRRDPHQELLNNTSIDVRLHFLQLLGVRPNGWNMPMDASDDDRPPVTLEAMRAMLPRLTTAMELVIEASDAIHWPIDTCDSIGWDWIDPGAAETVVCFLERTTDELESLLRSAMSAIVVQRNDELFATRKAYIAGTTGGAA